MPPARAAARGPAPGARLRLFAAPSIGASLDEMAADAGMSRRTFTRLFRAQTGASFAAWRQQVCLQAAIARLTQGQSVTRVALDLGYASPSAFARRSAASWARRQAPISTSDSAQYTPTGCRAT